MTRIFVVTGANKGIGYAIVRGLAKKLHNDIIYLTARNVDLGKAALKKIDSELGGEKKSEIRFHQLEITDEASGRAFAEHLKKEHGGLDVLINNAGFAFKDSATEPCDVQAEETIKINYYGTKLVTTILKPLIRNGGRIVNVCSQAGLMKDRYSDELIEKFQSNNLTVKDIDNFVEQYKSLAKKDAANPDGHARKAAGYRESAYCTSKAAEIAYSIVEARELKSKNIIVSACCPGYVDTDMTSHKGPKTIDQGADTPIFLALDENVHTGDFWYERKPMEWL